MNTRVMMTRNTGPTRKDKTWSMILAVTTCIGVAGSLGYRMAEQAPQPEPEPVSAPQPVTTNNGYTQEQLDAYAASLQAEATRLSEYRASLVATAQNLQELINQQTTQENLFPSQVKNTTPNAPALQPAQPQTTSTTQRKPKPVPAPKLVPAQQAPTTQTNTKSS